ncbi:14-3-3-like protein 2 [Thelohanellus kitauei]|uniref:14-3-3-like protein 2 n=1 Tax=Thelohanellus kitauei TaxID=669202 RepID=A0A0C2JME0_THEKT|nr:14-3-3-like protein 2 [Thelohanellus kitauei]
MAEDNERREYLLYYIDLCESVNLIDEMGEAMMERAKMPIEFSEKERNYFSICSKNTVGRLRTSHRHLKSSTEVTADNRIKSDVVSELTEKVVNKIVKACKLVEDTLENVIYPYSQLAENKIFCHKLIADYQRYRCEVSEPKERQILMESSKKHYQTAEEMAKDLSPVDLSKLGIALNFSVFCYEIENEHKKAYDMA